MPTILNYYMTAVNVGFVNKSVDAAPGGSMSICVTILDPQPPDIDPIRRIPIAILVSTVNNSTGQSSINSYTIDCRSGVYLVDMHIHCLEMGCNINLESLGICFENQVQRCTVLQCIDLHDTVICVVVNC